MTRIVRFRFRRLVIVGALGAGALGLALGTAASASASPTWGEPTPTVVYTPPPQHHKHMPEQACFVSLETEHDALPPEFNQGDQGGGYNAPSTPSYDPAGAPSSAPVYGQPNDQPNGNVEREAVEVVQLVRVCVTEVKHDNYGGQSWGGDRNRDDDVVTVTDLTGPFAWVVPASGPEPTPNGLPNGIEHMLTTK